MDEPTKTFLTLHGRIANSPAHCVEVRVSLDPPYELTVIGQVVGKLSLRPAPAPDDDVTRRCPAPIAW